MMLKTLCHLFSSLVAPVFLLFQGLVIHRLLFPFQEVSCLILGVFRPFLELVVELA
jgi:hypothetical protein